MNEIENPSLTLRWCKRLAATAALLLLGCVENPVTGEREFSLISPQQEVAIGSQNYQPSIQAQGGRYMVDPQLSVYVNQIGQKLAAQSERPQLPFEFVVLNNDVPNAWALPGGKIAINRGLLNYLQSEAELAAVLGHEVAHATARHSAQQMTRGVLLGTGAQILTQAADESGYGDLVALGTGLSVAAWQARYSREHELQADHYGMEYMSRAGYDPHGAVALQETFVRLSEENGAAQDFLSGLFASHPPSRERVRANLARAQSMAAGVGNEAEFNRAVARLRRDKQAYDTHGEALAALKQGQYDRALALVDRAIGLQGKENHFWETKAHILAVQKQFDAAVTAYDRAIALYPEYFSPYLGRGSVRLEKRNYAAAEKDLLDSQRYLPTQTATYLLGEASLGLGKQREAVEYFQRAAQAGGDLGQRAEQQLRQMGVLQ